MRPSPRANAAIRGVLGRALHEHRDVHLVAYWFLSNHYNLLVTVPDAASLSAFMNLVNSLLARELGRIYDWNDKFWSRRYRGIVIVGDRAQVWRLRYLLSQGTKENLVARPKDWPGVSALRALVAGIQAVGVWFNRSAEYNVRKRGKPTRRSDFETEYPITLHPLPCWAEISPEEQRARCRTLVEEIEETARRKRAETGQRVLGAKAILRQDPHHRPNHVAKSPAPLVHPSSRADLRWFFDRYYSFLRRYRHAASRFLGGAADAINAFPRGAFLPRPPVGLRAAS